MTIRFPNRTQRTVVVGRTGTGKTVAGLWHLSNYDVQNEPWVLIDFKFDDHINSIANLQEIDFGYVPNKKDTGLFVLHPSPRDSESAVDEYLWKLWEREHVGVFIDEAFMLGNSDGLNALLTQGRSKRIPMIVCTQRPVWVSRFAFSEASFVQVFDLNDDRDIATVEGFTPLRWDDEPPLGEHQSWYYDIEKNSLVRFNPVPDMDEIRGIFESKLVRKRVRL